MPTRKTSYIIDSVSNFQGMSFWFIKSSNESIGIVTLGTVSIAVRMPLYEKINTSVVKNHVIATN